MRYFTAATTETPKGHLVADVAGHPTDLAARRHAAVSGHSVLRSRPPFASEGKGWRNEIWTGVWTRVDLVATWKAAA